jgi:hypothetical protein
MGIAYDPTKPAANDKPANDQPVMQTNFASIKTLIDVDHVDFSNAYYGQHNQITFAADNVPSVPTNNDAAGNAQGVLFTNTTSGSNKVNQLFYYAGTATQSSSQYTIGGNGSVMVMGGVIIKWATVTVSGTGGTFMFAGGGSLGIGNFPNNAFVATTSVGNFSFTVAVSNFTTSQIVIGKTPTAGSVTVNIIMIGN